MTRFYEDLPRQADFDVLVEPAAYAPLPQDWFVGITDVVDSTGAIAEGRYKAVNMAGATVIAAMKNALNGADFPFVFGGDGASFAISGDRADLARQVLGQTMRFVEETLGLRLRAALIPVQALRANAQDVAVARHAASGTVAYAMFRGGGLAVAERALKRGDFAIAPAAPGEAPDLTGLSCRWSPIKARHGVIVSLIVTPSTGDDARFRAVAHSVLRLVETPGAASRPLSSPADMATEWPSDGAAAESRTRPEWRHRPLLSRYYLLALISFQRLIFARNWRVGAFDPVRYRQELVANSDFRKFDDGLKLTVDCTPDLADRLDALLAAAERDGIARYGLHRQSAAIVTCYVPAAARDDHVHFIDGADGGYAQAARRLKEKAA